MHVRLAVLADAANQSSDGKLNVLGEFNVIWASSLPVVWPRMFLVLKLEAEPGEPPKRRLRMRILDEDARPATGGIDTEVEFGGRFRAGMPLSGAFIFEFRNAAFPKHGTYEFEVAIDDRRIVTVPLYVLQAEEGRRPGE